MRLCKPVILLVKNSCSWMYPSICWPSSFYFTVHVFVPGKTQSGLLVKSNFSYNALKLSDQFILLNLIRTHWAMWKHFELICFMRQDLYYVSCMKSLCFLYSLLDKKNPRTAMFRSRSMALPKNRPTVVIVSSKSIHISYNSLYVMMLMKHWSI
jgi:hypothetical protein